MSLSHTIYDFPTFPISNQLFHVPGAAIDGGFTSGGVRMFSPEPGGRSVLEIQPSLQINEWEFPESSWLMSKLNGSIFRVRLVPTPQVSSARIAGVMWEPNTPWDNKSPWDGDLLATFASAALEGSGVVTLDLSAYGRILKRGHVLGHSNNCYMVDEINYDAGDVATVTLNPPLRKNVAVGDMVLFRPFFLGTISNGSEMRATYESSNVGMIQLNRIILDEAIV